MAILNRPALLLTLTAAFWAGNFVIGRAVAGIIPPITLAALRWGLAFLFFLPFAAPWLRREAPAIRKHWRILAFLGILGPGLFNTLSYMGLVSTEALNGLVLNAAGPMFIALAAFCLFGDRLSLGELAGLVAGLAGVLLIVAGGDITTLARLRLNPGDLLLVLAMVLWSIYTAFLRKRPALSWQSFNAVTYGVAAAANIPFALAERGSPFAGGTPALAAILYVAIFPSLIAYVFYNRGVELLGPARAGLYMFLVPLFGALLATLFLGERLHLFHAIGFALIIGGVLAGNRRPRMRKPRDASRSRGTGAFLLRR